MKTHKSLPPVEHNKGPGEWAQHAAEARKKPDLWYEVGVFHRSMVTYLRSGRAHGVDPAEFEVASRKFDDENRSTIYIKVRS